MKLKPQWAVKKPTAAGRMSEADIVESVKKGSVFGLVSSRLAHT